MNNVVEFQFTDKLGKTKSAKRLARRAPVSVFGLGYVGAVSMACLASREHSVIGVDPDTRKTTLVSSGKAPLVEPGLDELLTEGVENNFVSVTASPAYAVNNSQISFVCVGTPSREDGGCDTKYLEEVAKEIGLGLRSKSEFHVVAFRSTIPPGTCRNLLGPIIEEASGKVLAQDFGIAFHPEFLRECTAIEDFYNPPKTVVGASDPRTASILSDLYIGVDDDVILTSIEAAEMVKYVDNTWHATKVCFANEVGRLAKACGVDSRDVMDIFAKDTKLNISSYYMKPGFAFGGSCLPKDVRGMAKLARTKGVDVPLFDSLHPSNDHQILHALELVKNARSKKVALLGVTFKPGTDDLRESPMLTLLDLMIADGFDVRVYDPNLDLGAALEHHCKHSKAKAAGGEGATDYLKAAVARSAEEAVSTSDTLIVAHDLPEFVEAVEGNPRGKRVIDLARVWKNTPRAADYEGVCW